MNNIKKIISAVLVCILLASFNAHAEPMENISFADINEVMSYANEYVTWEDLQKLIDKSYVHRRPCRITDPVGSFSLFFSALSVIPFIQVVILQFAP
ncbi:MAG: hypothetical protein J6I76_15725 [Oribacterium sp.]|nr:hypothetical protein [Oribacterium sp.]